MINIGTSTINAVKLGTTNISAVYIGTTRLFPALNWFYLEDASGAANTVSIVKNDANAPTLTIETSTNGATWATLGTTSTTALNISVPANGKVYVRCNANSWGDSTYYNVVSSTGDFNVGGNSMSLIYGSNFDGTETSFPVSSTRSFYNMFYGASHLVDASALELPATTLVSNCYQNMFRDCTSLTAAPALPAMTLATGCYQQMFMGCMNLTSRPTTLPATTLAGYCYQGMFQNCSSLTSAPALPATTLASNCYNQMFRDCTSLVAAPALPATTLADGCYNGMFYGCTALTTASELPATTLPVGCYGSMYRNTAITTAPLLPATTLADDCYGYMFNGCTHLNSITCLATDISATNCTTNWVSNVAATGTFYKDGDMSSWTTGNNGIPTGWTSANYVDWFYVEDASGAANTLKFTKAVSDSPTLTIETSTDGNTWSTLGTTSTAPLTLSVPANGKVYVRSNAGTWCTYQSSPEVWGYNSIDCTGDFKVGGKVVSLLYGSSFNGTQNSPKTTTATFSFARIFRNSNMVNADRLILPRVFAADNTNSMNRMFDGCSKLTKAPSFPNGYSDSGAYNGAFMFRQCTGLTTAALPSTGIGVYGFRYAFSGCTSLTTAPELPATTLASYCYEALFDSCTALTTPPTLPATALADHCYSNMFYNCTALTTAPALPATTLAQSCYASMFKGCTSLTSAPATLPATTFANNCYQGMFRGCSLLTTAPVINGVTPVSNCLVEMFRDCPLINSVRTKATTWNDTYASNWLSGVAATGTLYNDGNATIPTSSASGVPSGWTTVNNIDYFYFENATNSANTVSIKKSNSSALTLTIETSTNKTTWTTLGSTSTTALNISIPANGKVYVRCTADSWGTSGSFYNGVSSTGNFKVGGNIMSLLYGSNFTGKTSFPTSASCFYRMFYNATHLVDASALRLPATTLAKYCYQQMFNGCTALTSAPATLPATTLVEGCYKEMFESCSSLTSAPELPATTLTKYCYELMFYGCSSLTSMQVAFTTWPSTSSTAATYYATYRWTHGLPASGTFYKKSGLSTQKNASGNTTTGNTIANCTNAIPYNWTVTNY